MRRVVYFLCSFAIVMLAAAGLTAAIDKARDPREASISTYHGDALRSGAYTVRGLTFARARGLRLDADFHPAISGHIHAQPLLWTDPRSRRSLLIVATEENSVYAIDAVSGQIVWQRNLGPPVERSLLQCGDIIPLGITGTPAIDPATQAVYLDAATAQQGALHHLIFALALADGSIKPGWPVDVGAALAGQAPEFTAATHNQRGAVLVEAGVVYVPYGGFFDCNTYRGTVVGVSLADPHKITRWSTRAVGGGIWAPGGLVADNGSLLLATGNTFDTQDWRDGEAVFRLTPALETPVAQENYFSPADWHRLDDDDADLGGVSPVVIESPNAKGPRRFVLTLGKDGNAYLLDHDNLGGIGGALAVMHVSARGIYAGAVAYRVGQTAFIAFPASGTACPGTRQRGLAALAVTGGQLPQLSIAWCAHLDGLGAPIVTTSDGQSDPIVWLLGAEGDNRLHAFRGDTGESLLAEAQPVLKGLHRFQTLIATRDRLFVAADNTVYAFKF